MLLQAQDFFTCSSLCFAFLFALPSLSCPPLEWKMHEGQGLCLLFPTFVAQCLTWMQASLPKAYLLKNPFLGQRNMIFLWAHAGDLKATFWLFLNLSQCLASFPLPIGLWFPASPRPHCHLMFFISWNNLKLISFALINS